MHDGELEANVSFSSVVLRSSHSALWPGFHLGVSIPSPIATSGTVVAEDSVPGPSGSTLPPSVGSASRQQG